MKKFDLCVDVDGHWPRKWATVSSSSWQFEHMLEFTFCMVCRCLFRVQWPEIRCTAVLYFFLLYMSVVLSCLIIFLCLLPRTIFVCLWPLVFHILLSRFLTLLSISALMCDCGMGHLIRLVLVVPALAKESAFSLPHIPVCAATHLIVTLFWVAMFCTAL